MVKVEFVRGTTSQLSNQPLVDGQILVDTSKHDILVDVEDTSTEVVQRISTNHLPSGGTAGQVLKKASSTDYDVVWGSGSSGGGGHTIIDADGNIMPDEIALQFVGLSVTDDPTNGKTVVSGSVYFEITQTLSTTANTVFTFTDNKITSICGISVYTSIYRLNPYDVTVSGNTCTVTFAPYTSAATLTCRIYVK